MFASFRNLVKKHQRKFVTAASLAAISYFLSNYVSRKIQEFQKRLKEENFAKEQIKRRFQQTQRDCYMTFLSLLPVLTEPIYDDLNVEEITKQLQAKRSERQKSISEPSQSLPNPTMSTVLSDDFSTVQQQNDQFQRILSSPVNQKSKTQLWVELKIQSITRLLTLLYCESLLIVFLHLQLNILSRKSYLETAIKLAAKNNGIQMVDNTGTNSGISVSNATRLGGSLGSDDSDGDDDDNAAEQAFLSYSWWILNRGWIDIKKKVESNVEDVFNEINPRQEITIDEFGALISKVQSKIDLDLSKPSSSSSAYSAIDASDFTLIGEKPNMNFDQQSSTLVRSLLPPKEKEFFLLEQTSSLDFLTKFNNDLSNTERLDNLMSEMTDYLNNEQIGSIVSLLVTAGLTKVFDNIVITLVEKEATSPKKTQPEESSEIHPDQIQDPSKIFEIPEPPKTKLAALLALITKQSNQLINNSFDNEILYALNNLPELHDLSASVYSNYDA